jgi:hypothetical protein
MLLADTGSTWQATVFAVALLAMLTVIMVVALLKLKLDGVLKVWTALGPLTGLVTGAIATYFFTRPEIQAAHDQASAAQQQVATITQKADELQTLGARIGLQNLQNLQPHEATALLNGANLPHSASQPTAWINDVKRFNALTADMSKLSKAQPK